MTVFPGFVFVHGAWHNADTWQLVLPLLRAEGFVAEALDLPGAGVYAREPRCLSQHPVDPAAAATEPSPNAGVTQQARTAAVQAKVAEVAAQANGQVVLVGHSLGGTTVSAVAEAHPEQLAAVVYLAALLLPPGASIFSITQEPDMPTNPSQKSYEQLLLANPLVIGATRLDWHSADPTYATRLKALFYSDVEEAVYQQFAARLHADEPLSISGEPSPITPARFGTIPRHYIRTSRDRATPLPAQDFVIARTDATMPTPTIIHTLSSGHSPFASQPAALAALLTAIAKQVAAPSG